MYMVSFKLAGYFMSGCGNKCFDSIGEAKEYIEQNKNKWVSYSLLKETKEVMLGVFELEDVEL